MKDKPFALIGVNSDPNNGLAEKCKDQQITWRSFVAGSTRGEIPTSFRIRGWPTLFLIDHNGVIRKRWVGSPGNEVLDKCIDALVAEAEKAGGAKGASAAGN